MKSPARLLHAAYRIGAVADGAMLVPLLMPKAAGAIFGISRFAPGPDYRYATAVGAALMAGWTALLLWADREPLQRRGILLLTVFPVLVGLDRRRRLRCRQRACALALSPAGVRLPGRRLRALHRGLPARPRLRARDRPSGPGRQRQQPSAAHTLRPAAPGTTPSITAGLQASPAGTRRFPVPTTASQRYVYTYPAKKSVASITRKAKATCRLYTNLPLHAADPA